MQKSKLQRTAKKLIYSPQLSAPASTAIRRFALSLHKPMTKTLEQLIFALPAIVDTAKICLACQNIEDCGNCIFERHLSAEEKNAILTAL